MRTYYSGMRTNNTPFSDICNLVTVSTTLNENGYPTETETLRQVFCSVCEGVVRSEYYDAMRSGINLSLTIEINADDYSSEPYIEHSGKRYKIERTYPTGYGTLECSCSEVIR